MNTTQSFLDSAIEIRSSQIGSSAGPDNTREISTVSALSNRSYEVIRLAETILPSAPPVNDTVDGDVVQYGKTGNTLKKYKFIGLFPTDVSQIDIDWGANDQIEEFTVSLAYQWWESVEDGVV